MVLTANDLQNWKNFPKGLRVLLLDQDSSSASQIQSQLEQMDYIVSAFSNEEEALSAISSNSENFHVAIVEVSLDNCDGRFRFLETAKGLPTIMTSNMDCLTTTMKCIALGAVEFLNKPLSNEKLKNIWQHVVHKAFSASGNADTEPQKPIKDSPASVLQIQTASLETEKQALEEQDNTVRVSETEKDQHSGNDKFPAPSTPQLKQGSRSLDDTEYPDQTNSSTLKESGEHEEESKFVEITCCKSTAISEAKTDTPKDSLDTTIKEEDHMSLCPNKDPKAPSLGAESPNKKSGRSSSSCGSRAANRKKAKVDWTPELHKKFVQAVEQLGVDQAIPSRILELMKVEGLTRHNVASHLQKYRLHRRHILPKDDQRRWPQTRPSMQRSYYPQHRPVMAFPPPYHPSHTYPPGQVYPMWAQPGCNRPPGVQPWGPSCYPWQPAENWLWKPYPGMHADAWGCPVIPALQCPPVPTPDNAPGFHYADGYGMTKNSADLQPGEEVIDKVVKEAISKPWMPLPIGLKPPSTETVLAELSRQGISAVPPGHRTV